jgi:hypothetical protein
MRVSSMRRVRVQVARHQVGFFRFLLEGYDGLATTQTVDPSSSIIDLHVPMERLAELETLLSAEAEQLGIRRMDEGEP